MAGIQRVTMTNPEADCRQVGTGSGRTGNIVTVYWKTTSATSVKQGICAAYAASQTAIHGPFAVAPTEFHGRLRQIEVLYPHGTTATPKTNYDMKFRTRGATATAIKDLAASKFMNIPIKTASLKGAYSINPVKSINDDIFLHVWNTGASATGYKAGKVRLYFE